jgi:hypothetical protein
VFIRLPQRPSESAKLPETHDPGLGSCARWRALASIERRRGFRSMGYRPDSAGFPPRSRSDVASVPTVPTWERLGAGPVSLTPQALSARRRVGRDRCRRRAELASSMPCEIRVYHWLPPSLVLRYFETTGRGTAADATTASVCTSAGGGMQGQRERVAGEPDGWWAGVATFPMAPLRSRSQVRRRDLPVIVWKAPMRALAS